MTAVIAAAALYDKIRSVTPGPDQQANADANPFYESWVKLTGDDNLLPRMLEDNDIEENRVPSLLNSKFIETIAQQSVRQADGNSQPVNRSYIAKDLEVMVTLTNLQGMPYNVYFGPDVRDAYVATNHLDFGHFVFTDTPAKGNGRIPINMKEATACELLRQSAMATGAFPLGLAPRPVSRVLEYIKDNPYINLNNAGFTKGSFDDPYQSMNVDGGLLNNEPFDRAEEIFKQKFRRGADSDTLQGPDTFRYTILMIDPFPSTDYSEEKLDVADISALSDIVKNYTTDSALIATIETALKQLEVNNRHLSPGQVADLSTMLQQSAAKSQQQNGDQDKLTPFQAELINWNKKTREDIQKPNLKMLAGLIYRTMRNQLLFKREDIQKAFDPNDFSRFMVVPKRVRATPAGTDKISGSKAIACGSLGGFGGFISQKFRSHDFFLGRMNCKRFLQHHFGVPVTTLETNPIFKGMYSPQAIAQFKYLDPERKDANGQPIEMVPIIPLVDKQFKPDYLPETDLPWPSIQEQQIYDLRDPIKHRSRAVIRSVFKAKNRLWDIAVQFGVWAFDGKVADTIIEIIIDNLREHRLLEPTNDVSRDV